MVLAEEVQDGNVLNLSDNVLGVIQSKMLGEVEDDNFNDPDYNLEEDDDDYHDFVTQRLGMKAKGRPKKGTSNRSNVVGPPTNGILIPQVNENAESDYYDSDELLEWGTDSEDECLHALLVVSGKAQSSFIGTRLVNLYVHLDDVSL
ncbi:hypothetical protein T459_08124 [Capsicum annuum]|uniref:Uncharacterized protein n=1 Tax=Capsicum annuum TaxID=4072 RepID=A0A2G2ZVL6_CAPAN|nr:hypothetical protein T459_08124 [Capsicum annuum]